eukprot:TRINITY_DN6697_c0_g1_i1.p2 TRINITY_DN6697_c0_g1~~TRINITY_DN6697_c0_g1_i1.p2  ORF type:complete len:172 (+),score=34.28 TRINITY_DN6697_c0_g1_i1:325-840(+)
MGVVISKDSSWGYKVLSVRTTTGAVPGNLEVFLLLRSLRTLNLRVQRQSKSALKIAKFLSRHKKVKTVFHPVIVKAATTDGSLDFLETQMAAPYSPPCFAFELHSGNAKLFSKNLQIITDATSLGGVETTIEWSQRFAAERPMTLLRISVGVEDPKDLIADLKQALDLFQQ